MYFLKELLQKTIDSGASDLHLTVGLAPTIRLHGKLVKLGTNKLTPEEIEEFAREILGNKFDEYTSIGEMDTSYSLGGLGRFRVNVLNKEIVMQLQ